MLLVDHDQAQFGEADLFLDEGVGADDNIYFASGDLLLYFLLSCLFQVTDKQRHRKRAVQDSGVGAQVIFFSYLLAGP
ncbi:hypothetical protein ES708_19185 [subsurface metagenome]